ncbi:acyl-CoA thioesterase [Arsenicicoccus sp. oral taxon 190]|uniref:acyl-CoA thioesterase n=1 Tax=Arsenicicoccus sp. oral taxon 190 TaxID=1658671 RepID=UPI000679FCC8|nr:acyl-CoA thioesterase II [Arsenicicoccus sp. oral taxon 190]AKT51504.1 acyl-CoA thioesterase [Arsenicicoccus sp. oral taxon 190]
MTQTPQDPFAELLDILDLRHLGTARMTVSARKDAGPESFLTEQILGDPDREIFEGGSQWQPHGRVFGGQVLAQTIIAAGRTVTPPDGAPARPIHSLHGYFVRPGDVRKPIRFSVERMRDGRSFSTRRVHAMQDGDVILSMTASFQEPAGGLEHQDRMPQVPAPETLASVAEKYGHVDHPAAKHLAYGRPIDLRHVRDDLWSQPAEQREVRQELWLRAVGTLPDDPLVHAAVMAYASDYALLEPVIRAHGVAWIDSRLRAASLDHAMWFHRPARVDEWMLYTQYSPSAQGGRGLGMGRMFTRDGVLAATVAQEGMVRLKG